MDFINFLNKKITLEKKLILFLNSVKKRFSGGLGDERAHMGEGFALALDIFEDLENRRSRGNIK